MRSDLLRKFTESPLSVPPGPVPLPSLGAFLGFPRCLSPFRSRSLRPQRVRLWVSLPLSVFSSVSGFSSPGLPVLSPQVSVFACSLSPGLRVPRPGLCASVSRSVASLLGCLCLVSLCPLCQAPSPTSLECGPSGSSTPGGGGASLLPFSPPSSTGPQSWSRWSGSPTCPELCHGREDHPKSSLGCCMTEGC